MAQQDLFKTVQKDESLLKKKKLVKPSDDYHEYTVAKLRKLARSIPNFPLEGRQISKANKAELISEIDKIYEK